MQPREIILSTVERRNPPRPGFTFDRGRLDDILLCCLSAHCFQQRRWIEGTAGSITTMSGAIS